MTLVTKIRVTKTNNQKPPLSQFQLFTYRDRLETLYIYFWIALTT